jgi:hypothetical protein
MNCKDQARKIYESCIAKVEASNNFLTYGEILYDLGYPKKVSGQAIRYGLELVLIACVDCKLPRLTSIIVNKLTGCPSAGEYRGPFEKEARKVFNFKNWPGADEIDWEYVWKNRKQLSDRHGTPGYWSNKG